MQLRVDSPNAKSIKSLAKDYKRTKGRKKSYAAIGNELIRDGLEKRTLIVEEK